MPEHDTVDTNLLAIKRWASRMAEAARLQAEAYELLASTIAAPIPTWLPASEMPISERPKRQAMLLAAVRARAQASGTGSIPRRDWLTLASHFGYDPRGTAGFFRRSADGGPGMLTLDPDRNAVSLAEAGIQRIAEFEDEINAHRDEIEASTRL